MSINDKGLGFFYSLSVMLTIILFLIYLNKNKYLLSLLLIPIFLFFGKKQILLDVFIIALIVLELQKKINFIKISFALLFIAFFGGFLHYLTYQFDNPFLSVISYFDYYQNLSFLIDKLSETNFNHYYGEISVSSYLKIIPRFIWEGKPIVYGINLVHQDLLPNEFALGVTPSFFEQIAIPFADFHLFGVIFAGLFNGIIYRFAFDLMHESKYSHISILFYYFSFALPYFIFISITLFLYKTKIKFYIS